MDVVLAPFERRLRTVISQHQITGPVASRVIAGQVNQPVRTVRYYLRQMESAGVIYRPSGRKSGYATARGLPGRLWRDDKKRAGELDDTDIVLLGFLDKARTATDVSVLSDIPRRTVAYRLKKLEETAMVERPNGQRRGYVSLVNQTVLPLAQAMRIVNELTSFRLLIVAEFVALKRGVRLRSSYLAKVFDIPERTMRYHLNALNSLGVIERRPNRKLGYAAVRPLADTVIEIGGHDATIN